MPFSLDDLDNNLRESLAIARTRRRQLANPESPIIQPNRIEQALNRRKDKLRTQFGDAPPDLTIPDMNGNGPTI